MNFCPLVATSQNSPLYYKLLVGHLLDSDRHFFMYTLPQLEVIFISVFRYWTAKCREREREITK